MVLCAVGTRAGESCNEHPPVLLSLPACEPRARQRRTQTTLPTDAPWRPFRQRAHHRPRRDAAARATVPTTPRSIWRDLRSITRVARGQRHDSTNPTNPCYSLYKSPRQGCDQTKRILSAPVMGFNNPSMYTTAGTPFPALSTA